MPKILFFACDPGGANAVLPIIAALKGHCDLLIFAKNSALGKYQAEGYSCLDIAKEITHTTVLELTNFLQHYSPDLVITGTSANDLTEKYLWSASGNLGITSLAILDQWINYGIRFSKYGLSDLAKYELDREFDYLPSQILVMDSQAEQQLIQVGVPRGRLLVTGNPYFEQIAHFKENFTSQSAAELKNRFSLAPNEQLISFFSEPFQSSYHDSKGYWGFTEEEILQSLIISLDKLLIQSGQEALLVIKLHPKEPADRYDKLLSRLKTSKLRLLVEKEISSLDLIMISDLVCGIFSMALQEAVMLARPIISIAIGLKRRTGFVLEQMGLAKSVLSQKKLEQILNQALLQKKLVPLKLNLENDSVKKIIQVIKQYVQISD